MASAGKDLSGVSGWAQNGDVTAVGLNGTVLEYDGVTWTETQVGQNELADDAPRTLWPHTI